MNTAISALQRALRATPPPGSAGDPPAVFGDSPKTLRRSQRAQTFAASQKCRAGRTAATASAAAITVNSLSDAIANDGVCAAFARIVGTVQ